VSSRRRSLCEILLALEWCSPLVFHRLTSGRRCLSLARSVAFVLLELISVPSPLPRKVHLSRLAHTPCALHWLRKQTSDEY
jgi:hypothetical protein